MQRKTAEPMRLQKYLSDCGVLSRRAADAAIAAGEVTVNGTVAVLGQKVMPGRDTVLYQGKRVRQPIGQKVYIKLNKPEGYVTTLSDEKGRPCVAELVRGVGTRVYPCGRLDMDSEGLLILTNDGELANKLTHPRHTIPKIYYVKVDAEITLEQLERLNLPMTVDGYDLQPVYTELISRKSGHSNLRMTLYEGRNRQIRKMCEQVGLGVRHLRRIAIGPITLGKLRAGEWEYLTREQVNYLKTR